MSHKARISRRELLAGASASAMLTASMPTLAQSPVMRGEHMHTAGRSSMQTITIANRSGTAQTNYPLQFGRPFVPGEIVHYPQVLVNGRSVQTQANVKNRYSDGSVKYAIIALIVPSIPTGETVTLSFRDQATGNNTPLSKNDMLHTAYDFDAVMQLAFVSGATASASARRMLQAGDYKLWTAGPIAQTVECADDSSARKYDLGDGDNYRPFRPRFYATFWPSLKRVQVRFVGENGLTTEIEDLRYNLTLRLGSASPQTVYTLDLTGGAVTDKLHWALTNWTKCFWLGSIPEAKINVDYNLSYLSKTKYFPNFDTSLIIPETVVANRYMSWTRIPNQPYDAIWNLKGWWTGGMSSPGARGEIGPYPEWATCWLYTGDWRMREIALTMADLAGAFPGNLRESDSTKRLNRTDPPGSGTGLGHAISVTDRKTICLYRTDLFSWTYTDPDDRVKVVGPFTHKWTFDGAHQPAAFFPQYILTGDPHYLSQMYLWAGFSAARYTKGQRGPTGAEGGIADELRGHGWVLRNRAEAAFAAPDDHPEKLYFSTLANDDLALTEGSLGITGTGYDGIPCKVYGKTRGNIHTFNGGPNNGKAPPLHNWESGGNPLWAAGNLSITHTENQGIFQPGKVGSFTSAWMQFYVAYCLGRVAELGFAAGPLRDYSGKYITDLILHSGNPNLMALYLIPVEKNGGGFMSWAEILKDGLSEDYLTKRLPTSYRNLIAADGYCFYACPGLAYLVDAGAPDAAEAWAWFKTNIYDRVPNLSHNPKWAIVPRGWRRARQIE